MLKALCVQNGFMKFSETQFCTKGKIYDIYKDPNDAYYIIDDNKCQHTFRFPNKWFVFCRKQTLDSHKDHSEEILDLCGFYNIICLAVRGEV